MDTGLISLLQHHWGLAVLAWITINVISTMPSPNGKGFLGSPWYKWLFMALHSICNIPRILVTIFPKFAGAVKLLPEVESDNANKSNSAAAGSNH